MRHIATSIPNIKPLKRMATEEEIENNILLVVQWKVKHTKRRNEKKHDE